MAVLCGRCKTEAKRIDEDNDNDYQNLYCPNCGATNRTILFTEEGGSGKREDEDE